MAGPPFTFFHEYCMIETALFEKSFSVYFEMMETENKI